MRKAPIKLPGTATLLAFEAAARWASFTRAAAELNSSQPAISRHVADLEARLGAPLFHRGSGGLSLTRDGEILRGAVTVGLGEIGGAIADIRARVAKPSVTVACSYDIAHLVLMPRYAELGAAIGGAGLKVLATEFEHIADLRGENIDLALAGGAPLDKRDSFVPVFPERVRPVAAPAFWERVGRVSNPSDLVPLPLLELEKPNFGWTDWPSWFHHLAPDVAPPSPAKRYPNYVYALEAAAAGEGVALGWDGYWEAYREAGRLTPANIAPLTTGGGCFAAPTPARTSPDLVEKLLTVLRTIAA